MTMTETSDPLAELYEDGDEITLPDGRVLKLTIEPDYDTSVTDDGEWAGEFQRTENSYYGPVRPWDWTDGLSRIFERERNSTVWWRPLPEVWGRDKRDDFTAEFEQVKRLYEDGYRMVVLTLYEDLIDSSGKIHRVEVTSQAIGGVDTEDPSYINQIARDLAYEMDVDA